MSLDYDQLVTLGTTYGLPILKALAILVAGGLTFTNLSGGGSHTCGVATAAGAAYCWGANATGQLGDGTRANRVTPVEVTGLGAVVAVGAGWRRTR